VAFVGPLPPPVNGFSNICAMMLVQLKTKMPVDVFDRAPKLKNRLWSVVRQFVMPVKYLAGCVTRRDVILYLALSGGLGQIVDLGYVIVSKLFRRPIFVHHHSFTYINAPSPLNRCLFALIRRDTHIVLSRKMGQTLASAYGLEPAGIRMVSNAAFYESTHDDVKSETGGSAPLRIGYLSNITFEKGFVEFFAILARLKDHGVRYRAHIAGPLTPDARETFDRLISEASDVDYVGPVYGAEKEGFYQQLDIFVFPTKYANEAEPLVVYEAMRSGVFVIACDRGAIGEMLSNGAGLAFTSEAVVESAAMHIMKFDADRRALRSAQTMSFLQAQRIRSAGIIELGKLLATMQGDICKENCAGLA
jgi:glycosyltransferase involved in cell wall biosynthesis